MPDRKLSVLWTLTAYLCVSILFMLIGYGFWQMCAEHTYKIILKIY